MVLCYVTSAQGAPFLFYFILIKLCELGKKQCGFFSPKVLGLEDQQAARNSNGPLSSGKRSVPVALMWKMPPVGKLQGPRRVAG